MIHEDDIMPAPQTAASQMSKKFVVQLPQSNGAEYPPSCAMSDSDCEDESGSVYPIPGHSVDALYSKSLQNVSPPVMARSNQSLNPNSQQTVRSDHGRRPKSAGAHIRKHKSANDVVNGTHQIPTLKPPENGASSPAPSVSEQYMSKLFAHRKLAKGIAETPSPGPKKPISPTDQSGQDLSSLVLPLKDLMQPYEKDPSQHKQRKKKAKKGTSDDLPKFRDMLPAEQKDKDYRPAAIKPTTGGKSLMAYPESPFPPLDKYEKTEA